MGSCERNPSPINLCESLMGQVVNNAVNSEEWRRASSSLLEIYAADLSDGEVPEASIRDWAKGIFVGNVSHGQSCLLVQDGLNEPGIAEGWRIESSVTAYVRYFVQRKTAESCRRPECRNK
jgi:hypothetical protein